MRYDLVTDMQQCVKDLEQALGELRQQTESLPLLIARVFRCAQRGLGQPANTIWLAESNQNQTLLEWVGHCFYRTNFSNSAIREDHDDVPVFPHAFSIP